MATRGAIGIKVGNTDKIKAIYVHWDGYPEYLGKLLLEHYQDSAKINKLISRGDASVLTEKLDPDPQQPHTFDEPQKGISVFYTRDRGEDRRWQVFDNDNQFVNYYRKAWVEYVYLFDQGLWYVADPQDPEWQLLADVLMPE